MKELDPLQLVEAHRTGDHHALYKHFEAEHYNKQARGCYPPAKKVNPLVVLSIVLGSWLVLGSMFSYKESLEPEPFCVQFPEQCQDK